MDTAVLGLAVLGAMCWGAQGYVGAVVSRELAPMRFVLAVQTIGFIFLLPIALIASGDFTQQAFAWGSVAAATGVIGWVLMYAASAIGQIAVTQKLCAGATAILPFFAGLLAGFRPSPITLGGLALLFTSLLLLSTQKMSAVAPAGITYRTGRAAFLSCAAGLALGGALVALGHTSPDDGLYPFVMYRLGAALILLIAALATRTPLIPPRHLWGRIVLTTFYSTLGDVTVLIALQHGSYALIPAVTALAPGVTALLARWLTNERLRRVQTAAIIVGLAGLVLVQR